MTYIGSHGCVIIGDKRRIAYFGDKNKRVLIENELYSGDIKDEHVLRKRAEELGVTIKITNDAQKVRSIGDVVVGEVIYRTPFETKRKRIYATTNGYNIIEIVGSTISKIQKGDSSIVVFGNKITKKIAKQSIQKHWNGKLSLKDIAKIFEDLMVEVYNKTPSVSREYDRFIKHGEIDKKEAQKILRETMVRDVRLLQKWRAKLREDMISYTKTIEMTSKIISQGEVGRVNQVKGDEIDIILSEGVQALDVNWKLQAKPGEMVSMQIDDPSQVTVEDQVVIEDENLHIERTGAALKCEIILVRADH